MRDYVQIGCTPSEESCLQVGHCSGVQQRTECSIFKHQLERAFPEVLSCEGVSLRIKGEPHEFGTYYEVRAEFDTEEGGEIAFRIESETPTEWDEQAKCDLRELGWYFPMIEETEARMNADRYINPSTNSY